MSRQKAISMAPRAMAMATLLAASAFPAASGVLDLSFDEVCAIDSDRILDCCYNSIDDE